MRVGETAIMRMLLNCNGIFCRFSVLFSSALLQRRVSTNEGKLGGGNCLQLHNELFFAH